MTDSDEIEGVIIQPLRQIADNRGPVLHMLRRDSDLFKEFGEVYFSEIHPGSIKAWKRHKGQTQNLTVPIQRIRLVIYDARLDSGTKGNIKEYEVGRPNNYKLIQIPPMLWYGFQALDNQTALIANCVDRPHDPREDESLSSESDQIPYQWKT
ncbi:MAG: dTDP-4-dehydrorhamnose 3,5-epimerase [Nitrospina sp.]|nr:dTDP-4-dehydrorhamnose 3,5-epimerase [Nitrospina sp.]|tara:strand:+ start:11354 stop:11812 length:459 start_codon:yes stop_codon:yes gene_type:complete